MKAPRSMQFSDKENIHPNILLPSTEDAKVESTRNYPKVSCFGSMNEDQDNKDWRKRILTLSYRQKALCTKLQKMLKPSKSPSKPQLYKLPTQACSNNKNTQKLGSTLRRYLYQQSQSQSRSHMNITFTSVNMGEILEELQKITEEIVGVELSIGTGGNLEEVLVGVVDALREYRAGKFGNQRDGQGLGLAERSFQ